MTGPTGSGKTTTLYSTLKQLSTSDVNVCTIEDPIEMVEPHFNQMQVQSGIGLDFATGVRTLMRQDPDIIMVGEIRDTETADMAVQAALTGDLVLSTCTPTMRRRRLRACWISAASRFSFFHGPGRAVMGARAGAAPCASDCREPGAIDDEAWKSSPRPGRCPSRPAGTSPRAAWSAA